MHTVVCVHGCLPVGKGAWQGLLAVGVRLWVGVGAVPERQGVGRAGGG